MQNNKKEWKIWQRFVHNSLKQICEEYWRSCFTSTNMCDDCCNCFATFFCNFAPGKHFRSYEMKMKTLSDARKNVPWMLIIKQWAKRIWNENLVEMHLSDQFECNSSQSVLERILTVLMLISRVCFHNEFQCCQNEIWRIAYRLLMVKKSVHQSTVDSTVTILQKRTLNWVLLAHQRTNEIWTQSFPFTLVSFPPSHLHIYL